MTITRTTNLFFLNHFFLVFQVLLIFILLAVDPLSHITSCIGSPVVNIVGLQKPIGTDLKPAMGKNIINKYSVHVPRRKNHIISSFSHQNAQTTKRNSVFSCLSLLQKQQQQQQQYQQERQDQQQKEETKLFKLFPKGSPTQNEFKQTTTTAPTTHTTSEKLLKKEQQEEEESGLTTKIKSNTSSRTQINNNLSLKKKKKERPSLTPSDIQKYARDRTVSSSLVDKFIRYVIFSSAAYCMHLNGFNAVAISNENRNVPIVDSFSDLKSLMSGYTAVDHDRKEIMVVFRGTSRSENWFTNFQMAKCVPNYCTNHHGEIHFGFLEAYSSIRKEVKASVIGLVEKYRSYNIAFVGHSLGGALATIAIGDAFSVLPNNIGYLEESFNNYKKDKATLFTVGAPRIGNREFAHAFADAGLKASYRLVRNKDIVPHLPPTYLGYHHSPKEYWITPAGQVVDCDDVYNSEEKYGEDTDCANLYASKPLEWSILEHMDYFNITLNSASRQCIELMTSSGGALNS